MMQRAVPCGTLEICDASRVCHLVLRLLAIMLMFCRQSVANAGQS